MASDSEAQRSLQYREFMNNLLKLSAQRLSQAGTSNTTSISINSASDATHSSYKCAEILVSADGQVTVNFRHCNYFFTCTN